MHQRCHCCSRIGTLLLQSVNNALAVSGRAVLAHLPFSAELRDGDFESDNRSDHFFNVLGWGVRHFPGSEPFCLMPARQFFDVRSQPYPVLDDAYMSTRVDNCVIPGRDHSRGFFLAGIPGRRDKRLGALKYHECLHIGRQIMPQGIGSRDMGVEGAVRWRISLQQERDVVRLKTVRSQRHQRPKRIRADQLVKRF